MQLVGVSGKAGSGKDFFVQNVLRPLGFIPWGLADHFKVWLASQGRWTYEEVFHTKPEPVRRDLQQEGTERGRNVYGENIWVDTMLTWMRRLNENAGLSRFACSDVRFPNERAGVEQNGGIVIRMVAPERVKHSPLTPEQRLHPSETALDAQPWTYMIYNDVGMTVAGLRQQFQQICYDAGWAGIASDSLSREGEWLNDVRKGNDVSTCACPCEGPGPRVP